MSSRPTKGLIALNADGERVDDARRRLLADWCRLVGHRVQGGAAMPIDVSLPPILADVPCPAPRVAPAETDRPALDAGRPASDSDCSTADADCPVPTEVDRPASAAYPAVVADLGLPPRMSQVLLGLLAGAAEKQIARELALSPHTIHAYVKQIYKRLEVSSRGELLSRFVTLNR